MQIYKIKRFFKKVFDHCAINMIYRLKIKINK